MDAQSPFNHTVLEVVAAASLCYDANPDFTQFDNDVLTVRKVFEKGLELPIARAAEMIETINQHYTLSILQGREPTAFHTSLVNVLQDPTALTKTRLPQFAPKVYATARADYAIAEAAQTSEYLGEIDDRIELEVTVVRHHFIAEFNTYSHIAISNGNLIKFNFKKSPNESTFKISGKIRHHDTYRHGGKLTVLNYVKMI